MRGIPALGVQSGKSLLFGEGEHGLCLGSVEGRLVTDPKTVFTLLLSFHPFF